MRAFFSFFRRVFQSTNTPQKMPHIIRTFYKRDFLNFTNLYKSLITLVIFTFWLNIGIIPKTEDIIFVLELEDWHRHIRTATDMQENFWFFSCRRYRAIQAMLENIARDLTRKTRDDKLGIFLIERTKMGVCRDTRAKFCRRNTGNM